MSLSAITGNFNLFPEIKVKYCEIFLYLKFQSGAFHRLEYDSKTLEMCPKKIFNVREWNFTKI